MTRDRLGWAAVFILAASCKDDSDGQARADAASPSDGAAADGLPLENLAPSEPMVLSPGNLDGQDEDPTIVVARDGSLVAAWYSNRAGLHGDGRERKEIFAIRSTDGTTWSEPVQVSDDYEWNFYPSLGQGPDGRFRLAWMRWYLFPQGCVTGEALCPGSPNCCVGTDRRIVYNESADALTWAGTTEIEVTSGPEDELASLVAASDGRVLVYFTSAYREAADGVERIYVVIHDGNDWGEPIVLANVSSDAHHDTFPHVVEATPGVFVMTWTRYDLSEGSNLFNFTTQTMTARSTDGVSWTDVTTLTAEAGQPALDVFPYAYSSPAGEVSVVWMRAQQDMNADVVDLTIGSVFPDDLRVLDIPGYTPRIAQTATPGVYWAAWAAGTAPTQKIGHRFFSK